MVVKISDIISDARISLKDSDERKQFTDNYLCRILTGFGRDIHALSKDYMEESILTTVQGTRAYAYPTSTMWSIVAAWVNYSGSWYHLPFERIENIENIDLFSDDNSGIPNITYLSDGKICFYPIPDGAYSVRIISIKRFAEWDTTDTGISTVLNYSFSDYFDSSYKDIASRYITMNVLCDRGDPQGFSMKQYFYDVRNSQSDWNIVKRIEGLANFNARNRRTEGVPTLDNNLDYSKY